MKKKLLIIDDSEMLLGLIKNCLKEQYKLFLCTTIKQAEGILQKGHLPDAIITDLSLLNDNGKEFMKRVRLHPVLFGIPLIILSGEGKSQSCIKCLKLGANDFVLKPFHPLELKLAIEKQLNKVLKAEKLLRLNVKGNNETTKQLNFVSPSSSFRSRMFDTILVGSLLISLSKETIKALIFLNQISFGQNKVRTKIEEKALNEQLTNSFNRKNVWIESLFGNEFHLFNN